MPKCLGQTGTGDWRWAKKKTGSKRPRLGLGEKVVFAFKVEGRLPPHQAPRSRDLYWEASQDHRDG